MIFAHRPRARRSGLLLFVFAAACPAAQAGTTPPVPPAQYTITLNNGAPITTPGTFTQGGATGQIDDTPAPLLFAHVDGGGTAIVQLLYYFRVNGPGLNLAVPIQIDGNVHISAGGGPPFLENKVWGVTAQVNAQAFDGPIGSGSEVDHATASINCNPTSEGPMPMPPPIPTCSATVQDEAVLLTLDARTGGDNRVSLIASANNMEAFTADFDAQVDPVISFAPGFDATGYSIELSDGVGNAVPEAGGPLMAGTGVAVLALVRRRK